MSIYRIYAGADGESHMEEVHLAQHAELGALMHVARVGIHEFSELRTMEFHPLTERRLIIHLRGEVEIGVSDGSKQIFRPGEADGRHLWPRPHPSRLEPGDTSGGGAERLTVGGYTAPLMCVRL
jgi:hypothetical protein